MPAQVVDRVQIWRGRDAEVDRSRTYEAQRPGVGATNAGPVLPTGIVHQSLELFRRLEEPVENVIVVRVSDAMRPAVRSVQR